LSRVSLAFSPGVTALLGPNGAGKSTLLKLVVGILRPSSGSVTVLGEPPFANPRTYERLGVVPEEEEIHVRASAMAWLTHLLRLRGLDDTVCRERAEASLNEIGLGKARDSLVTSLSRGMKQRLRIAQAIAHEPDILVMDEPLTGLDPVGRRDVIDWIRRWGSSGKTVVVSSHILHEVELMTREVVLMATGRVLANGNIHEIRRLMDAHPHRIWVTTQAPRALARRLFEVEGLDSISYSEESRQVRLETRQPDRFYATLSELALEEGVVIEEITSPDDNLESVFQYLVGS
jgi:ABC-2 type transport system ATP-binding protein